MRIRYPLILTLGVMFAAQSQAASFFENPSILGGLAVGQLNLKDNNFVSPSNDPAFVGYDGHAAAWTLSAGFQFNRFLSVEVGRMFNATTSQEKVVTALVPPTGTPTLQTKAVEITDIKSNTWQVSAIGSWPLNEAVSVYARVGMARWQSTFRWSRDDSTIDLTTETSVPTTQYVPNHIEDERNGNDPIYGGGIALNIDSGVMRLEYLVSQIRGFDSRTISLSASWRFRPW